MAALVAMAKLFICIVLPQLAAAAPQVKYPLNQQFPPVARVGLPFDFQLAPTTFSSKSGSLQYSLVGNPSWLSMDNENRTLSGTPRASDVGTATFTIAAAGEDGAVANMESKLLVSTEGGPKAKDNISAALSAAGQLSGPSTVILKSSKAFDISFPSDSFDTDGERLSYFALLSDRTPLPAWISFDASSMHFAGTAPSTESSQAFDILLIASEIPDFAASSISFTMAFTNHTLLFEPFSQTVNVAKGDEVHITDLKEKLLLDDSPIGDNLLQSVTADLPPWLTFDNNTFEIQGEAPSDVMSQDLTVTAKDQSGDVAEYTIHLVYKSELFANEMDKLNLTLGESFEYTLPRSILAKDDESVTIDLATLTKYLHYDPNTSTISGTVPGDFPPQDVQCSITARSSNGALKDTQTFDIKVAEAANSELSGKENASDMRDHRSDRKRNGIIVGSVIGGVCGVLLLAALAFCLHRRRKNAKSNISPKLPRSPKKSDISRPTFVPYGWPDIDEAAEGDMEKGKEAHDPFLERTPEHAPTLDLDLSADRSDSRSVADSIDDVDTRILDDFEESSWGIHDDTAPSQHPHDSMKIPTELARRVSQRSDTFRKHKRRTTTVYQDQIHRSTGLPVNRRITGMGHGRHTYSPSRSNTNFSIRRPLSTSSYTTTRCTSMFSTTPSVFPQSPAVRKHTTFVITPTEERRSIRLVPASRRSSLVDRRTIDEKRSSYIRKRASAQSPFFSAGPRALSSSYRSPPAFISEVQSSPSGELSLIRRNTIVRPDDDVMEGTEKDIPQSLRIVKSTSSLIETPRREFLGSFRTNRTNRPHTAIAAARDRVEKSYARPGTAVYSGMGRRASTRHSLRVYDLKASLNDLTGSKVFEDADMSDSIYSDEEREIEEAERRTTIKPDQYTLPPLNLDRVDTARNIKRDSKTAKRKSNHNSKRELKRTSERDPTPYFHLALEHEHGGKENASSTYTLGQRSSPTRIETKGKARAPSSPEQHRPTTARQSRANETRKSHRASANRTSKAVTRQEPVKERHSRRSIHSRSQSYQSGGVKAKKTRDRSRTQSSAYPFFDTTIFESTDNPLSIGNAITANMPLPRKNTKSSLITRDLSGNLAFYGDDEEPTIEELRSSSIGFRTSNGRVNSTARQSRLASLHLSSQPTPTPPPPPPPPPPPKSSKRDTVLPLSSSGQSMGLGLFPQESPGDGRRRQRTPRSMLESGNGATPEPDERRVQGRKTWGGGLRSIVGRGGRWVSGGYWDKQGKEEKVFI